MKLHTWLCQIITTLVAIIILLPSSPALAAPYITLDTFSGTRKGIHVSGGGWTPQETISLYFNGVSGSPVTTVVVGDDSFFPSTLIHVPANTPQGPLAITAVGSVSNQQQTNSYYVVPYTPGMTIISGNSTPGSTVTIDGNGFAPNESVRFWLGGIDVGNVLTDSSGSFTGGTATVPAILSKTYELHAIGQTSGADTHDYFYIGGFYPSAAPSLYYILPGQVLNFSGSGFASGETLQIFEGNTPRGTITADADGAFINAGNVSIPVNASGAKTFRLYGTNSNASVLVDVTVGTFNTLIAPSSFFILPGEQITFTGEGFAANELVKIFDGDNHTELAQFMTDTNGNFSDAGTLTIPFGWSLAHTFRLVGQESNAVGSAAIMIGEFNTLAAPSSYRPEAGQTLTFSGTGFAANEMVTITTPFDPLPLDTFKTDATGAFTDSGALVIPFAWADSSRTLHLEGQESRTKAVVAITVAEFLPQIAPSAFYIAPGQPVTLSGTGFAPNEMIDVALNGQTVSITASSTGAFSDAGPFTAPFSGTLHFTAIGKNSNIPVSVDVLLATLTPMVNPSGWYVPSGSTVTFTGSGFGPQEHVRMASDDKNIATIETDASGSFANQAVNIGFGKTREIAYTFTGLETGAVITIPITVAELQPYAWLDIYYIQPGNTIHASGAGFAPNEQVTVSIGTASSTGLANNDGMVSSTAITIPYGLTDATVTMTGAASGAIATTNITVAPFNTLVTPSTWYAQMGSTATFTGTGFAPSESIAMSVNGAPAGTATADTTGMFSAIPLQIPYGVETADFTFTGMISNAIHILSITVAQLYPGIQLSTYYAAGGTAIDVYGTGYAGNEEIALTFDEQTWGTIKTDDAGNFTFSSTVPYRPAGEKTIKATGVKSKANATSPFTEPQMYVNGQLGSYAGAPATAVTFVGSGYAPGEKISITTDRTGATNVHTFTVDATGNFTNAEYIIPADFIEGPLTFTMSGEWSVAPVSITYYVTGV